MRYIALALLFFPASFSLLSQNAPPTAACVSTCTGNLGENIFPNGDFGKGTANVLPNDPGFAPGYLYQPSPPPNDGYYTIGNNTTPWGWFAANDWINIKDNSPDPLGYMMVVNASNQPGLFFRKKVSVCESTLYEFSIDVISVNPALILSNVVPIFPDLTFLIDGAAVCETGKIPHDGKWHTFRFSFTAQPGLSEVELALRNNAPGGIGNDLAIDNISFRACGPEIDLPATAFFCAEKTLTLQANLTNSPYNTIVHQWQSSLNAGQTWTTLPGATSPTLNIVQSSPAQQYRLVVASTLGNLALTNCRAVSFPVELMLEDLSQYSIGGTDTIVCNGAPGVLRAGNFAQYLWSNGSTSDTLSVPVPGTYAVTVTSVNGCTATDDLLVYETQVSAGAEWENPVCAGDSTGSARAIDLGGGTGSLQFVLDGGTPQPSPFFQRIAAGQHLLLVRDSLGCEVAIDFALTDPPPYVVSLSQDRSLYLCDSLTLTVSANYPPVSYDWSPATGLSCDDCLEPLAMPLVTSTYALTVTDALGCTAVDSVSLKVLPRLDVYAPNVFRPDISENGENNSFALFLSKSAVSVRRFDIYDRWGGLVFRRENQLPGAAALRWDGWEIQGKPAPAGVYVWLAEVVFSDGTVRQVEGDVLLVR